VELRPPPLSRAGDDVISVPGGDIDAGEKSSATVSDVTSVPVGDVNANGDSSAARPTNLPQPGINRPSQGQAATSGDQQKTLCEFYFTLKSISIIINIIFYLQYCTEIHLTVTKSGNFIYCT
jgi:hypothetical protein